MATPSNTSTRVERLVATGFTTALLGDERTLREFIVGDLIKTKIEATGEPAVLYLFNDSCDPLTYRQLRVAVNKDEQLLKRFEKYCGQPISEIPDPFECHENYSKHFEQALLQRLETLDIRPVVVDSYHTYRSGAYADVLATTFERYTEIQEKLAHEFGRHMANDLFRVQCVHCRCLDGTHITGVDHLVIRFGCDRCGTVSQQTVAETKGKLSWKLDCAARWNLYGIDIEMFSKAHVAELGTVQVARFVSRNFYGGKVPSVVRYGDVMMSRDLSLKLLEILPPPILKTLFTSHIARDLHLTREIIESFCRKYPIRPGTSYVDYIQRELPFWALCDRSLLSPTSEPATSIDASDLVAYGNRFSKLYYQKEYRLRAPTAEALAAADQTLAQTAHRLIQYALSLREGGHVGWKDVKSEVKSYLASQPASPHLYRYLRVLFDQAGGPNITTLLAILPKDYLIDVGRHLGRVIQQDCWRRAA